MVYLQSMMGTREQLLFSMPQCMGVSNVANCLHLLGVICMLLPWMVALYREVAEFLLDHGVLMSSVTMDKFFQDVPPWAPEFVSQRNVCRAASRAILQLQQRRASVIGRNGRDVLRIVSAYVWETRRRSEEWAKSTKIEE